MPENSFRWRAGINSLERQSYLARESCLTQNRQQFEAKVMPHLNAAFSLARWLLKDDAAAQDVVQESMLRAFRFFEDLRNEDARPWLLGIVRNGCFTWLRAQARYAEDVEYDEEIAGQQLNSESSAPFQSPEQAMLSKDEVRRLNGALESLVPIFREVVLLREVEELSYEEIARITDVPLGTVMSRLARGRKMLRALLADSVAR